MICGSLAVNLFKLHEALDLNNEEVINKLHEPLRKPCIELRKKIKAREICALRNKHVAHVKDNKTKQPISSSDRERLVSKIFGGTIGELNIFCDWVGQDVLSVVVSLRGYCRENGSRGR